MASWKDKREAIRQAIIVALDLKREPAVELAGGGTNIDFLVQWQGRREAARWTGGVWCDLRLGTVIPVGRDETRRFYNEDDDALRPTYGGQRSFTVMVIVASDDQEDEDAVGTAGSRLRTRIRREEVKAILAAVDVSLAEILSTSNFDFQDDGVQYSQSMTELQFNTTEEDEDTTGTGDWIREVEGSGDSPGDLEDVTIHVGPIDL